MVSGKTEAMRGKAGQGEIPEGSCSGVMQATDFGGPLGETWHWLGSWWGEEISGKIQRKAAGVKGAVLSPHFLPEIKQNK